MVLIADMDRVWYSPTVLLLRTLRLHLALVSVVETLDSVALLEYDRITVDEESIVFNTVS